MVEKLLVEDHLARTVEDGGTVDRTSPIEAAGGRSAQAESPCPRRRATARYDTCGWVEVGPPASRIRVLGSTATGVVVPVRCYPGGADAVLPACFGCVVARVVRVHGWSREERM